MAFLERTKAKSFSAQKRTAVYYKSLVKKIPVCHGNDSNSLEFIPKINESRRLFIRKPVFLESNPFLWNLSLIVLHTHQQSCHSRRQDDCNPFTKKESEESVHEESRTQVSIRNS